MIFDNLGLPFDVGSTDKLDSARLAGIMTVFEIQQRVECSKYYYFDYNLGRARYVRHPEDRDKLSFSRDQAVCLMAGLWKQGLYHLVSDAHIDGSDVLSPSVMGHVRRCQNRKPSFIQEHSLWLDVIWSCKVKPWDESNQILCMLMVADRKYMLFYLKNHPDWRKCIRDYWSGWRGEGLLAEQMIKQIEGRYL